MVDIAVSPLVMKDAVLNFPTDNYSAAASAITCTPTSSAITWAGLALNTITDSSAATWAVAITYAQDWETVNSLSQYLHANEGNEVAMTFGPKNGSGPTFTVTVIVVPGAIGGTVNTVAETTVTLPAKGKPVLVPGV